MTSPAPPCHPGGYGRLARRGRPQAETQMHLDGPLDAYKVKVRRAGGALRTSALLCNCDTAVPPPCVSHASSVK